MKTPLILIFFLLAFSAFSQTLRIDSIPNEGVLLNKGWKFQAGDNPDYAKPGYDDSKWTNIQLSDYNAYLPRFKAKNMGWFRLNLLIDSSTRKKQLAIQLSQLGASEIYLNGKLFQQLGSIKSSSDYKSFNPNDKPMLLAPGAADSLVIAIRFVSKLPSHIWLFAYRDRLPLTVKINTWFNAFERYEANSAQARQLINFSYLAAGLAFLFILFYVFFPKEKLNLLFGALLLFGITRSLFAFYLSQGGFDLDRFGFLSFLEYTNDIVEGSLVLSIIAIVIFGRITLYVWIIIFWFLIDDLHFLFIGPFSSGIEFISHAAVTFTFLYLSIAAVWRRNYIFGFVAFNSFLINLYFFSVLFHMNLNLDFIAANIMAANLIIITIYLAINFAKKSKNLEVQLIEIKTLSNDNLKKEKEKQQILASQKETLERQVTQRTSELKQSLDNLKSTQAQLIQSEKMASLGELTAGIAHEIQNPLNFVNNFSEVNEELIEELQGERRKEKGERNEEVEDEIINGIKQNLEKINHHGKRADAIVKGMLQHSKQTSGVKEPTDINALCDEYLRLSYHGMRAKDKNFNAEIKTDFENEIGKINIVPQDIGRVLLNLFNNAFYAVNERQKKANKSYQPTVIVETKKVNNKVELTVKDNGNGIPQNIVDKIFQPFFTTKPTGQGTGLGLSLSYDIIKAHGGKIKVETKEGESASLIIQLPLNNKD